MHISFGGLMHNRVVISQVKNEKVGNRVATVCTGVVESGDGAFVKVPYKYQWIYYYLLPIKVYSDVFFSVKNYL